MSTNCNIAVQRGTDDFEYIYCHSDGYPNGGEHAVGNILTKHYNDPSKVDSLIAGGDLSQLAKNIIPTSNDHSFENRESGTCVFYHRDRGEPMEDVRSQRGNFQDLNNLAYTYIYREGTWVCFRGSTPVLIKTASGDS